MDSGNKENFSLFFRKGMDCFSNKTLSTDGMISVVDALVVEPARWTFQRLVAIRKANHDQRLCHRFLKRLDGRKPVKKKITVPLKRFFPCIRFKEIPCILERMFPEKAMKDTIFIVLQKIDETFPAQKARGLWSDPRDIGQMFDCFKWSYLSKCLCSLIPQF